MHSFIIFIRRRIVFGLLAIGLVLSAGCGSFNHNWNEHQEPNPLPNLEGRWQGVWLSDVTHHTDKLRCVVTKKDDGSYAARFQAKYHTVLTFGYTVPLKVETAASGFKFSGEANLGWLAGGLYNYDGHADTTNFFSTYTSKYDRGTFQMTRP